MILADAHYEMNISNFIVESLAWVIIVPLISVASATTKLLHGNALQPSSIVPYCDFRNALTYFCIQCLNSFLIFFLYSRATSKK